MLKSSFVACVAVALTSCSKPKEAPPQATSEPTSSPTASVAPEEPIDACSLLTSQEIEAVVGEAVAKTKDDRQAVEGFTISQCYYTLPTAANSITLRLVQPGQGPDARNPGQGWKETFERDLKEVLGKKTEPEGRSAPVVVEGVGEEAYWMGGPAQGGLYVLKGKRHFRLGVGGEPNQMGKIEKAKKLSASILGRL